MTLALAVLSNPPLAGQSATWAGAAPGPHAVGLTIVPHDPASSDGRGYRSLVWRPVQADLEPVTFEMFARALCPSHSDRPLAALVDACFPNLAAAVQARPPGAGPEALARIGGQRLHAGWGGTPLATPRPVMVMAGSLSSSGGEFISVAEAVASHGYVVAAVVPPSRADRPAFSAAEAERARHALAAALSSFSGDSGVDTSQVVLAAWSFGGVPATIEALGNPRVQALISLDSAVRYQYGSDLIRSAPGYRPDAFRGSALMISAGVENSVGKDDSVLVALSQRRIERYVAEGLAHADFSDQYGALPALLSPRAERTLFHERYARLLARIVTFLERATVSGAGPAIERRFRSQTGRRH